MAAPRFLRGSAALMPPGQRGKAGLASGEPNRPQPPKRVPSPPSPFPAALLGCEETSADGGGGSQLQAMVHPRSPLLLGEGGITKACLLVVGSVVQGLSAVRHTCTESLKTPLR